METTRLNHHRESYTPSWEPERYIVPLLAQRIPELIHQFCELPHVGARALDAGCGMQPFRRLIEQNGYQYTGMDVVQNRTDSVDILGALDEPLSPELQMTKAFDMILCTEVLEHVAGWSVAFDNLAHLLAPNGRILLTCPHFYPLHEEPYDFWRPTPYAIDHFAKSCGLRVVHAERAGGPWEVLGTLLAETHCYPSSRSIVYRLAAKTISTFRSFLVHGLQSSWWRSRIALKGPYFLSNLAVLEVAR